MTYNKYKIDEIEIGDQIYFDSTTSQSNHDEYWPVHGKDGNLLLVRLNDEYWSVDISDVRQIIRKK